MEEQNRIRVLERSLKSVKGILFDLGNTLIDFEGSPWEELDRIALQGAICCLEEKTAWQIDFQEARKAFHESFLAEREKAGDSGKEILLESLLRATVARLGLPAKDRFIPEMVRAHYSPIRAQISLYKDTLSTLQFLKKRSLRTGLVSNTYWPASFHLEDLEHFELLGFFDALVFSSSFGYCKPHPSIFREGLKRLGTRPEETLFVGDRLDVDIAGAQSAGLRGILKRHPHRSEENSRVIPDGTIEKLEEIRFFL